MMLSGSSGGRRSIRHVADGGAATDKWGKAQATTEIGSG